MPHISTHSVVKGSVAKLVTFIEYLCIFVYQMPSAFAIKDLRTEI